MEEGGDPGHQELGVGDHRSRPVHVGPLAGHDALSETLFGPGHPGSQVAIGL